MNKDEYDFSKLTRERYEILILKEKLLDSLKANGVDNWEGYEEALKDALYE